LGGKHAFWTRGHCDDDDKFAPRVHVLCNRMHRVPRIQDYVVFRSRFISSIRPIFVPELRSKVLIDDELIIVGRRRRPLERGLGSEKEKGYHNSRGRETETERQTANVEHVDKVLVFRCR